MRQPLKEVKGLIYFPKITVPNIYNEYSVELVLSDEDANDFESRGFKTINGTQLTKTGEQKTSKYYEDRAITIKRNVKRKDGTLNFVPKLYDTDGSEIHPDKAQTIGNESEVTVKYREWFSDNEYGKHQGLDLCKVRIDVWKHYEPDTEYSDDEF